MTLHPERAIVNEPLTQDSEPGTYVVGTASRTIYVVQITSPDLPPQVTRLPAQGELLNDGVPMPGVSGFSFDATTGLGEIHWWKDNPEHYDQPDKRYVGTTRTTNIVLLIVRLHLLAEIDDPRTGGQTLNRDVIIARMRATFPAIDPPEDGR